MVWIHRAQKYTAVHLMRMFPSAVVPHVFMFFGCQSTFMPYIIYSFPSFYSPQLETKASNVMQSISSLRTMRECPTDGLQTSCCRLCSLHSSELQHSSAHTELPGSFQGCCSSVACSLCHKHKQKPGMSALALAAPSPLGIQEMENAMDAGREPLHTQITNRHKPCMSALYSFPTPFMCSVFISLTEASIGTGAGLAPFLWGHTAKSPVSHFSSPSCLVPLHHQPHERIQGDVSACLYFCSVWLCSGLQWEWCVCNKSDINIRKQEKSCVIKSA